MQKLIDKYLKMLKQNIDVKRQIRFLVYAFVGCIILGIWSWMVTPRLLSKEVMPEDSFSLLDTTDLELYNYEKTGNNLIMIGEDPEMYLKNINSEIQTVAVYLRNEITTGTKCQIFYPDQEGTYSEERSEVFQVSAGQKILIFHIPLEKYEELRIDIDDNIELEDICASASESVVQADISADINPLSFVLIFVLIWAGLESVVMVRPKIQMLVTFMKIEWRKTAKILLYILLAAASGMGIGSLICIISNIRVYWQQIVFWGLAGILVYLIKIFSSTASEHPERLFASVCIIIGLMFAILAPVNSFITWDDAIHYENSLALSYGGEAYVTKADESIITIAEFANFESSAATGEHITELNQDDRNGAVYVIDASVLKTSNVGYIPAAVGLWLGRILCLPFSMKFMLGRLFTLLVYTVILYHAIKIVPFGKTLMATVALMPTAIFQASNYTYDSWLTALVMLGVALYLSSVYSVEGQISLHKTCMMIAAFVIGCMPKAIYFPIMAMTIFVPKERFKDKKQRIYYYALILVGFFAIILSFVIPFLIDNSGATDSRGGTDVNAIAQMAYMFTHIITYIVVLFRFLITEYLNPKNANQILTYVGYFPVMYAEFRGYLSMIILLIFTALTDKSGMVTLKNKKWLAAMYFGIAGSVLLTICMIATVLYMAFTPVGSDTIIGCQGRYLLPLLFAGLWVFNLSKIKLKCNWNIYTNAIICCVVIQLCSGMWEVVRLFQ